MNGEGKGNGPHKHGNCAGNEPFTEGQRVGPKCDGNVCRLALRGGNGPNPNAPCINSSGGNHPDSVNG